MSKITVWNTVSSHDTGKVLVRILLKIVSIGYASKNIVVTVGVKFLLKRELEISKFTNYFMRYLTEVCC